jgi:hypothetical protein
MKWTKVQGMKLPPQHCTACGSTGEYKEGEGPPDAYFAEAVDVNWGQALYLCDSCVRILGTLRGMMDVENVTELQQELTDTTEQLDDLQISYDALQDRVERMLGGVKAKKEIQADRQKPRKKVAA